jgi:hypothetical protein
MKRIAAVAAAAGAGLAMLVAAPAHSEGAPRPTPAEFEIAAPEQALGAAKAGTAGSVYQPVRAPAEFTMMGFRWSGDSQPGIAVRVSEDGASWGPWTTVPAAPDGGPSPGSGEDTNSSVSEPVWAGPSNYLQYRLSETPADLRLHFINTDALDPATAAKRNSGAGDFFTSTPTDTTGTGSTTDTTATDPVPPDEDDSDRQRQRRRERQRERRRERRQEEVDVKGVAKEIIPRKKWDPHNDCKPRHKSKEGDYKAAIIHHTVNANDYSKNEAKDMVLGICRFHRNGNGWDDIGYNFVVDKYGELFEGRNGGIDRANVGAHAIGFNEETAGIANLGDFDKVKPSKDQLKAQAKLIAWLSKEYDFPVDGKVKLKSQGGQGNRFRKGEKAKIDEISGHKDLTQTDCPGTKLYGELKKIRKLAD